MDTITSFLSGMSLTDKLAAGGILLCVLALPFLYSFLNKQKKLTRGGKAAALSARRQYLQKLYILLSKNRLTRNYIASLTKRFSVLSVYQRDEIQRGVANYTKRLFYYTAAAIVISCFLFDDIMSVIICVAAVYVYYATTIELNIQKDVVKVYYELKHSVSSIALEYKKTRDVQLALENADYGPHIAPVMADLREVLCSERGDQALSDFYERMPFKQVQTLAMVCYNINNTGDEVDEKSNRSTFDDAMLIMNSDINQKIEEYNYESMKFGKLELLCFVGIAATIIFKIVIGQILPSAAVLYHSVIGLLIQYGVMGYSIYAYWQVAHGHIRQLIANDDRKGYILQLMERPAIKKFVKAVRPKNARRRILQNDLDKAFSKRSVEEFTLERYTYAAAAFIFLLIVIFMAPHIQRRFIKTYTGAFDLASVVEYTDDNDVVLYTTKEILAMDEEYMKQRDMGMWEEMSDEDVTEIDQFINSYLPKLKLSTMELQDQRRRLESKYEQLNSGMFHWWYAFLPFIGAFMAYQMPMRTLKKRKTVAADEEEEEFLQLQVVMMILCSMNFDTLTALGHLAQIADIHKEMLLQCYYGYAADPVGELERMAQKTGSENFKYFIRKLEKTVEDLSIKEAFEDLASDREHICTEREEYVKNSIDRRRAWLGQTALRPFQLSIYGMMVFPLVYTGLTGLSGAFEEIQSV
jgi:hypothetical protein